MVIDFHFIPFIPGIKQRIFILNMQPIYLTKSKAIFFMILQVQEGKN